MCRKLFEKHIIFFFIELNNGWNLATVEAHNEIIKI